MTPQDHAEINLAPRSLHQADQHEPPALPERLDIRREIRAADTVEDNVGAAAAGYRFDQFGERSLVVVDRNVGAEFQALLALFVAARRNDGPRTIVLQQLNRRGSHPAAAAMN